MMEESEKAAKEVSKNKLLKQQLELREVELNVAPLNKKNAPSKLLLKEGAYNKMLMNKNEAEIHLFSMEDEEDKDCEALRVYIEQKKRLFRYLYGRYANTGYSSKSKSLFEELKTKSKVISIAEIIKMFKEHNVTSAMLPNAVISSFVKLINSRSSDKRNTKTLTYEGFIDLFVQAASHIYSRDSKYLGLCLSPVAYVKLLINHFKQATVVRGESTLLYDNSDATDLGDPELAKELSNYLAANPFYPLPDGYKKIEEKHPRENYAIPSYIKLNEATKIAVEVLDFVLHNALDIHLLEPITTYDYKLKVVPVMGRMRELREPSFMMPVSKKLKESTLSPARRSASLKQLMAKESEPRMSVGMKLAVAGARKDKGLVREVAKVVAEIVNAVEEDRDSIDANPKRSANSILNRAMRQKMEEQKKKALENEMKEKKRKTRAAFLKDTLNEHKREQLMKDQEQFALLYSFQ